MTTTRFPVTSWPVVIAGLLGSAAFAAPTDRAGAPPAGLRSDDWVGIRAAYDAGRHAAYPVDDGYRAANPGQAWRTRFDGRGFTTSPDAGSWAWGLELVGYGFPGEERVIEGPVPVHAEGSRVRYDWDDGLSEWYVNDRRGLEHGYTVHRRPPAADGPLTFRLAVRGDLRPVVLDDGRGVNFVGEHGAVVVTYAGLTVFDADGDALPAGLEAAADGLLLTVDERDARYPLTIDPIAQQAYLKSSNTAAYDGFGISVAASGDTIVVGATGEDSSAVGVNGDQSDNSATNSGAAYVFVRNGTTWSQQAYLKAAVHGQNDLFGKSVGISGGTIVVGADFEDSGAAGVNGDQSDDSVSAAGAAYVFVRSGTTWSQQAYLKSASPDKNDWFGRQVAISGDTVVVGVEGEDSGAVGVNGDPTDDSVLGSGAAYVFARSGTTWSQQAYLKASFSEFADSFSAAVSVSGDTIVIGADFEDGGSTGVNGDQSDNSADSSGAAYVFVRGGTAWSQQAYLKASNAENYDRFGSSVSVSGDTVVVTAVDEDSKATGVNGDQTDNSASSAGAAYVFTRSGTTWTQQAYLKASNTELSDDFGQSVAVSGDTLAVGAHREGSHATGVDGDQTDNSLSWSGAAYLFTRSGPTWSQTAYLKSSNPDFSDSFGSAIALSCDTLVVAASGEASGATGVNGDQSDNSVSSAGAAYVFIVPGPTWCDLDFSLAGSNGRPVLEGNGTLAAGATGSLDLSSAAPNAMTLLLISMSGDPTPFAGGNVLPIPVTGPYVAMTSGAGSTSFAYPPVPAGIPAGTRFYLQCAVADPGAPFGASLSNALKATTP